MVRPRGRIDVVCQNPACHYYRLEEGKDIIKRGKDARTSQQRYYCKHCKKFFMATKGTILFRRHLPETEIITICKHFVEKNGIRSIERITGHHRDTIGNLLTAVAEHATEMNDILIQELGVNVGLLFPNRVGISFPTPLKVIVNHLLNIWKPRIC